jgi:signal peptidase II
LIFAGAVSNLIDRARLGYVVDYIDLKVWPVFNLADSAITIGIALFLFGALFKRKK